MASADIVPVPGEKARRPAIADRQYPKTVVLDLEQPVVAIKRTRNSLDDLKRESKRTEHAAYFEENWLPLKTLTSAAFNPYRACGSP
jgi:hypothetical protein